MRRVRSSRGAGWLRWPAVATLTVVLVGLAGPAAAHNSLRATDPAADSTVARTPTSIVLTFDEPALALGTQVVVTGPGGPVQAGAPRLVDETVTQDLLPGSPAGSYTVQWRVTSADGHPITGTFSFISEAASDGAADTSSAPPPGSADTPAASGWAGVLPLVAAVVVLVAAVVIVANLRRRRTE